MVCLSRIVAVYGRLAQHQNPGAYSLSSLPKASFPSLSSSLSSPLCPTFARDLLSLAISFVVNLVTLQSAVRLKHQRARAEALLGVQAVVSSGYFHMAGSGLPEKKAYSILADDLALQPWHLLSQFSPQGFCPQALLRHLQLTLSLPLPEPMVSSCK